MMSSGINLVMTVIGFSVSTMFIVFVCTRLICARIHLHVSRRSLNTTSRSDLSLLERGFHGLEKQTVAKFPTKKYSDEFFSKTDDSQCTVCLADYRNDDLLRILPNCGHSFHMTCIDIWLQQHSTCPVCRISLREFPERRRLMQPLFSSHIRSHYNIETFQIHGPNCPLAGLRLPVRNHNNHGMGPIDDNHCVSENNRTDIRENCVEARVGAKDSRDKHVESPSNP